MAAPKTQRTSASVSAFLAAVENPRRRADAQVVLGLMKTASGERPALWGPSIIGFGTYIQTYANGSEAEWPLIGFSPRKAHLVLYLDTHSKRSTSLLARLGKHKQSKACLYINSLADIDLDILRSLIEESLAYARAHYRSAASKKRKA